MPRKTKKKSNSTQNASSVVPNAAYVLCGFPKDVRIQQIQSYLPEWLAFKNAFKLENLQRLDENTSSVQLLFPEKPLTSQQDSYLGLHIAENMFKNRYRIIISPLKGQNHGSQKKSKSKADEFARDFWRFVTTEKDISICDRDHISILLQEFCAAKGLSLSSRRERKSKEFMTMTSLRKLRLAQTQRSSNFTVLTLFADPNDLQFPSESDKKEARQRLKVQMDEAHANKGGVEISEVADRMIGSIGEANVISFEVKVDGPKKLRAVTSKGQHGSMFRIPDAISLALPAMVSSPGFTFDVTVTPKKIGVLRAKIHFLFDEFVIVRSITMSCGDKKILEVLQPSTPYQRKKTKYIKRAAKDVLGPPKSNAGGSESNPFRALPHYHVPAQISEKIRSKDSAEFDELMSSISWQNTPSHVSAEDYGTYWQHLLYAGEHQMKRDIQLYDMENVSLKREGRHFILTVPGLAEGRPSVLRGDMVELSFNNCLWRGRVMFTRQLEVVMELHRNFVSVFNPSIDRVSVHFTFSRMTLRTSHNACGILAEDKLKAAMLVPTRNHVVDIMGNDDRMVCPICLLDLGGDVAFTTAYCRGQCGSHFHETCIGTWLQHNQTCPICRTGWNGGVAENNRRQLIQQNVPLSPWANRFLNSEQQAAVQRIANGVLRPLPYIIFGPPGTGKTTTVVETIYQLGKKGKKIILVAPSNDASDVLVERLSSYFPPSELRRILAYSRSRDLLPASIQAYASDSLGPEDQKHEILSAKIVVSTVNLAARFSYWGIQRGHFDVLCVDEAGHATEPEVIAVAAALMDFQKSDPGQLILAGDPKQLGPITTSEVCLKYGLSTSYMERLCDRSVYQPQDGKYPKDLLTKLVRNYRSHSSILKLPNEMFYDNDLEVCGDLMVTSNMLRWEHLPKPGFPVVFHAISGSNCREGNSPSWFNPEEAQQVVEYVRLLMEETRPSLQPDEIGIITPYARQAQKIRLALKTQGIDDIKVGSVETFQGQERRVIIISTVRAEREEVSNDLRYNLGFVANPKRFNVAVTRAKALLIVIGCPSVLEMDKDNWLPFMKYCHDNQSWTGDDWDYENINAENGLSSDDGDDSFSSEDEEGPSQTALVEGFVFLNLEE